MNDINYFSGIVKLLENPTQSFFVNSNLMIKLRAQLPQTRKTKIVNLVFWGNLASDVSNYYKINDYIIIEGYLGVPSKLYSKRIEITVFKTYPFVLDSN